MGCKYTFGKELDGVSYSELYEFVLNNFSSDLNSFSDLLFSQAEARRKQTVDILNEIKLTYSPRNLGSDILEESSLTGFDVEYGTSETMSVQEFLSSELTQINGNRLYVPFDKEEFIKRRIAEYKQKGLSEEEASKKIEQDIARGPIMQDDAMLIHKLITFKGGFDGSKEGSFVTQAVEDSSSEQIARIKKDAWRELYNEMCNVFWKGNILKHFKGDGLKDYIKKGFNIQAEVHYDDNVTKLLSGHIDYAIVDDQGHIHLYNFVVTSNPNLDSYEKRQYYELKLLTLKRMLQYNGINSDNISLNYIPIYVQYNEDGQVEHITLSKVRKIFIDDIRNPNYITKDHQLSQFIKSNTNFNLLIDDNISERLRSMFTSILPSDLNINETGIHKSIDKWIHDAPQEGQDKHPLVIKQVGEPNNWFEVYINGKLIANIRSSEPKSRNQELKNVIIEHIKDLNDNRQSISYDLYRQIKTAYQNNKRHVDVRQEAETTIDTSLLQYLRDIDPETGEHRWELIDDLIDYNIILFKKNNKVDVVYLSSESLDRDIDFGNGQHNLLGKVKLDTVSRQLRGTYGNLSTFISILILNEFLPKLNLNDFQLGKVRVLSQFGTQFGQNLNIEYLVNKYFNEIITEINKANPGMEVKNNFSAAKFADPIEDIIEQLELIVGDRTEESQLLKPNLTRLKEVTFDKKALELRKLLDQISTIFFEETSPKKIYSYYQDVNSNKHREAVLYKLVDDAWLMYSGQNLIYDTKLENYEKWMAQPAYISSNNARLVVNNYRAMLDAMSDDINDLYDEMFYSPIMDYYKAVGYTALENSTIGFQERLYRNMFERDDNGKIRLYFKNPYKNEGNTSYLTDPERKFLKNALYLFNKFIHPEFVFNGPEDERFIKLINSDSKFLQVPLERASSATKFFKNPKDKLDRFKMYIREKKNLLDEISFKIDDFTRNVKYNLSNDADIFNKMHVRNKFKYTSDNYEERQKFIQERGVDYFETNIENLLIDVLGEAVEVEKTNRFLTATKAILFQLEIMRQDYSTDNDTINKELEYVSTYMKVNVFKKPLVSGAEEKALGVLMPIRKAVVSLNLVGNLIGFCRDVENGFVENYFRTLTKYQTDITKEDVSKAYKTFFGEVVFTNPMRINLLNKLCTVYRISNTDLARITERLKTGRAGLTNYENWLYATLRAPDFLHRMVAFMAKCIHDGVIDPDDESQSAFSIKDNRLVYDWKKDKRFKNLARGDKNNPKYAEELGLYIARMRTFNEEHPDRDPLSYEEALPQPYSEGEIQAIKSMASNIYGDYDRSNKAMYEFKSIGLIFGMWTTWMNGILTNLITKPGQYNPNQRTWTQAEDADGKLFINPNNFNEYVHENELKEGDLRIPVYNQELSIAQGLIPTLNAMRKYSRSGGVIKEYITSNPNVSSLLNKSVLDAIISLIILLLFKLAIDPAYQDHKKQDDGREFLTNVFTQLIYKSTRASFDTFRGPFNIGAYIVNNTASPVWQTPSSILHDLGEYVVGNKTMGQVISHNTGFGRTFQDAVTMYKRDVIE